MSQSLRSSLQEITVLGGIAKDGTAELIRGLTLRCGTVYAIVGHTGSGKSRLIKDIEQLADGDSITQRRILIDGQPVSRTDAREHSVGLVAHLGQNMRFSLDLSAAEFIRLHASCRGLERSAEEVLSLANTITAEPIRQTDILNQLSGGQTRALMIADIALICDCPIVLIDEIENAGIDKEQAIRILSRQDKLILIVTHDPHTALMAEQRIVMRKGGLAALNTRTEAEKQLYRELSRAYRQQRDLQIRLRQGMPLSPNNE